MRPRTLRLALGVMGLSMLATCQRRVQREALRPRPPAVVAESPAAPPVAPSEVPGAAAKVEHPRAAAVDDALGARVAPRPLPLPRVGVGRSAAFRFDGQRRGWVAQLAEGAQLTTPAYAQGRVYVGAGFASTTVYALDARTGSLAWTGDTPDGGPSAAIVEDGTVLFNTESCTLFAFDVTSGRPRWSRWLGDPLMSQPAAAGARVFSAWPDGSAATGFMFGALSSRTGAVLWKRPVPGDVVTAPVVHGGAVYFTTMDGSVHRFAPDGRRAWSRALGATSAPAVEGDRVYVARRAPGGRERQAVLAAADGRVVSQGDPVRAPYAAERPDAGGVEAGWAWEGSRPAHADGRLYYAMGDRVVARDVASGRVVWQKRSPLGSVQRGLTSPAVVGSQLVVGTRGGDVFGLDIDTGETTWAWRVGEPVSVQPVVANGWVYVATARGKVLGLEVGDRGFDGWHMWGGNARHDGPSPPEAPGAQPPEAPLPSEGTLRALAEGHDGDPFPLVDTRVDVEVSGHVARATVEQSFRNPHDRAVDAEYLFPLPSEAAVDAMELRVGQRVIRGDVRRRDEARRVFAGARARGRTAALLEQERPNLFRQRVANVRPGEDVRVVIRFAEPVPWRDGTYELALPLSTGSRYTPGQGGATPARPPGTVDVRARLDVGVELAEVASLTHRVRVERDGAGRATVTLAAGAEVPDRDFVLRYRPRVETAAPAVVARRDGDDGFFTLVVHPDAAAPAEAVTPRELVFVVDTSSSMRGRPLEHARAVMRRALERLRPGDTFRLLRFSDEASELAPAPLAPTDDNRRRALEWVDRLAAAGATEMINGLTAALGGAADPSRMRTVVLLTDGYVGNERDVLAAVQRSLGLARVFAVGVGSAVNRYLLESVAEVGRGSVDVVTLSEDPARAADRFYTLIDRPLVTDVQVDWGGLDARDVYPRVVPDLYADRLLVVHGRYGRAGEGDVVLRGRVRGRAWQRTVHVALPAQGTADAGALAREALPSVWARARIKDLSRAMLLGDVPALRDEVTALGLRFGLVTDYTSFVAVDEASPEAPASQRVHDGATRAMATGAALGAVALGTSFGYGRGGAVATAAPAPAARPEAVFAESGRDAALPASGSLDRSAITAVVTRNAASIRAAYERALRSNPAAQGTVAVRFVIGPGGRVLRAEVVRNDTGDDGVAEAIRAAVLRWVFPEPEGGSVTVVYPFRFSAEPSGAAQAPTSAR